MGEGLEEAAVERIKEAAAVYNDEVEAAKALNIKVTTTPRSDGRVEILMIQIFRELYKREENG